MPLNVRERLEKLAEKIESERSALEAKAAWVETLRIAYAKGGALAKRVEPILAMAMERDDREDQAIRLSKLRGKWLEEEHSLYKSKDTIRTATGQKAVSNARKGRIAALKDLRARIVKEGAALARNPKLTRNGIATKVHAILSDEQKHDEKFGEDPPVIRTIYKYLEDAGIP